MERVQSQHCPVSESTANAAIPSKLSRFPALGYIVPFAVLIGFLLASKFVPVPPSVRFFTILAALAIFSRGLLPARPSRFLPSIIMGVAVFFIWIGPDLLFPGYRSSVLFSNFMVGYPQGTTMASEKVSLLFLTFRVLCSVIMVPILEELFWRGWMMRWIRSDDFSHVPIGTYHPESFWIVAFLFASEHGSYWDVGLAAGIAYNWWAIRTRNLMDCVLAHAVTNACLAIYVIGWGQWQYWL
jgi:hypothetical protein